MKSSHLSFTSDLPTSLTPCSPTSYLWAQIMENKLARARASKISVQRPKVASIPTGQPPDLQPGPSNQVAFEIGCAYFPNLARSNSVRRTNGQTLSRADTDGAAGDDDARLVSSNSRASSARASLRQSPKTESGRGAFGPRNLAAQGSKKNASPLVRSTTASLLFPSGCTRSSLETQGSLTREDRASVLSKGITRAELGI